ncbi:MAG: hypothetical protein QG597_3900 [Actinomycetota bacterium]|nr:hypothetical protein [Actinomycetota bacterium]
MAVASLPVVRAAALADAAEQPRWLVKDIWAAAGVGVIGGHPKSFKTWLGLEIAVSVASGTLCLGRFHVPVSGPVLAFLAEDAPHAVKDRLVALCFHHGIEIECLDLHVIIAHSLKLDRASDVESLDATIESLRPRLVLLDPLVRLHSGDENSSQTIASLLDSLRSLQRKHDCAVILVHHARKNGSVSRHGQALRGSSDIWAFGDSNIFITQKGSGLLLTVEHRSAAPPDPMVIALVSDPPHLVVSSADGADIPTSQLDDRIIDELSRSGDPVSRTELRRRLGVNNKRLGQAIDDLERNSTITRTPEGLTLFRLYP